ncbi:unnamed protein product [Didymodactylos carnosus]|uniref:Uncharacterized protein n=1 Tax=Didymodactylos carnosus TaxID=1234261 RepID=A0A814V959_9BILA|nr:unnamed protein product [Didymodactylos carnosus]CAF3951560.1 unnamed protein product [Didymodactylos carnosus]
MKSQLQQDTIKSLHYSLKLKDNLLNLPPNTTIRFTLILQPKNEYENEDIDIDVDVILAIDSSKNLKTLKVFGHIRPSKLSVMFQEKPILNNQLSSANLPLNDFLIVLWDPKTGKIMLITQQAKIINNRHVKAMIKYDQFDMKDGEKQFLATRFSMELNEFSLNPNTDKTVKFSYYPIDFCDFDGCIHLQLNSTAHEKLPYEIKFNRSRLETTPKSLVDIRLIKPGKTFHKILIITNTGRKILHFNISEINNKITFIKSVKFQQEKEIVTSFNQQIRIEPKKYVSLHAAIDCDDEINIIFYAGIVQLFEFEVLSQRDPVITLDSEVLNRIVKICVIGHLFDNDGEIY